MNKLFGDDAVAKLRTMPSGLWVLFVFISFFFSNAYENLITGEYAAMTMAKIYAEYGIGLNIMTLGIVFALLAALIQTLVFEIILAIIFGTVVGRYRCQINKPDFKFRIRYLMIIINLVIGITSIGYFFTQYIGGVHSPNIQLFQGYSNLEKAENFYETIQASFLPFLIQSAFCLWFYQDFRKRFVPKHNQASLFGMFAIIFVGIHLVLFLISVFRNFMLYNNTGMTLYGKIAYSLNAGVILLVGVMYFFYYRKLKNDKTDDDFHITITETNDSSDDKIFDEFGF